MAAQCASPLPASVRRFRATVQPRGTGGLQITNLTCTTQRGRASATIAYTLSAPATVEAKVLGLSGRVIRTLAAGGVVPAGPNTLV